MTVTYHYESPDYEKLSAKGRLSKPLTWLTPDFVNNDPMINDEYGAICDTVSDWNREKKVICLGKLIYKHLAQWQITGSDTTYMYGLWCTMAMIEDYNLGELLPFILEILKQDIEFQHRFFIGESLDTMPAAVIFHIMTEDNLPMLLEFMKTPGLTSYGKRQVALACGHYPSKSREALTKIQSWLGDVLSFYYSSGGKDNLFDENLLETLSFCAIHTQSTDLKKLLIKFYGSYKFPCDLVRGGCNEVRSKIATGSPGTLTDVSDSASYMLQGKIVDSWDAADDELDEDEFDGQSWDEDRDFNPGDYEYQSYTPWSSHSAAKYKQCQSVKRYTVRVNLQGTQPPIWRELEVPSNITLASLANIIIIAMGWMDEHLHQFITKSRKFYATAEGELCDMRGYSEDGRRYCIGELLRSKGESVTFEYDYGDSWEHKVTLMNSEDYGSDKREVRLLGGERACPPEDCGGIYGYMELCEAMKHPTSVRARELTEWLGSRYDPALFPLDRAKAMVSRCNEK